MTPPPKLRGSCNRCGRCCEVWIDNKRFRCVHLAVGFTTGYSGASACRVYKSRKHMMPVDMVNVETGLFVGGKCAGHGSEEETETILDRGIGRGCSLEVVQNAK